MAVEQTLSIIKPDGVQKNLIGEIYGRFEKSDLEIIAARMLHLSKEQAREQRLHADGRPDGQARLPGALQDSHGGMPAQEDERDQHGDEIARIETRQRQGRARRLDGNGGVGHRPLSSALGAFTRW